jgi:hypothetical protein
MGLPGEFLHFICYLLKFCVLGHFCVFSLFLSTIPKIKKLEKGAFSWFHLQHFTKKTKPRKCSLFKYYLIINAEEQIKKGVEMTEKNFDRAFELFISFNR